MLLNRLSSETIILIKIMLWTFLISYSPFYIINQINKLFYTLPKKYTKSENTPLNIRDLQRDGYSKRKIPQDLDYIIIGSGISGLTTAAVLSKIGKRVLVLEQHYIAGGCCHTFTEDGYEFDTGIHYVGNIKKLNKILDLVTDSPITWTKMGNTFNDCTEVYDEIVVNDKSFKIRSGEQKFTADLIRRFPNEKTNIQNYFKLVKHVNSLNLFFILKIFPNNFIKRWIINYFCKDYLKYAKKNAYDTVFDEITQNKDLIAILFGQHGDAATPPKQMSFIIHAGIVGHYLDGGYYPNGGPSKISGELIKTIVKYNGRVLVRKGVKKIILNSDNSRAIGVEMANGDIIYSKNIISSVGFINTFQKLIPKPVSEKLEITKHLKKYEPALSYFYIFLGLKHSLDTMKLTTRNVWGHPCTDLDKGLQDFCNNPTEAPIPYFIAFPSSKDNTWNERMPYKTTAVILTMLPHTIFKEWENQKCMHRDEDYTYLKNIIGDRLINECFFKHYPELKDKIQYKTIGTPLTNKHYLGSPFGECLGMPHTPERFTSHLLTPHTEIKNLYMTGQDLISGGFAGALESAILTLNCILGYGTVSDIVFKRDLIKDLARV